MRKARCSTPTEFGKEMRKIRIEVGEKMKDTAKRLGVTQAFISHIENGKCQVPKGYEEKVIKSYNITGELADTIRKYAYMTKKRYIINPETSFQKEVAAMLSDNFNMFDDSELLAIKDFIEECLQERHFNEKKELTEENVNVKL